MRATIAKYIDGAVMQAIADEYRRGRLLLIGTTNLDAQRPVVWNIGEIAASGAPGALDLIGHLVPRPGQAIQSVPPPTM